MSFSIPAGGAAGRRIGFIQETHMGLRRSSILLDLAIRSSIFLFLEHGCAAWRETFAEGRFGMRLMADRSPGISHVELFYSMLRRSGICYLLRKCLWRNQAAILYYHDPKPGVIDAHLKYLARISRIVSLSEMWSSFSRTPLAVVTIDDGMAGNLKLENIFRKHKVRPTLYLCTGIVCSGAAYWWLFLGRAQQAKTKYMKSLDNNDRKRILYDLGFDQSEKAAPAQAMAVEDLRSVSEWADLGAHSRFHPILTKCGDQECKDEIALSRQELLSFIGFEFNDFAYPNGDYSDREVAFVKDAGFVSARTCDPGWNCPGSDRFRLKGIYIDDEASVDKFAVQLTGVPALARNLIRKVQAALTKRRADASKMSHAK